MMEAPFFLKEKGREKQSFTRPLKPKKAAGLSAGGFKFLNSLIYQRRSGRQVL